MADEHSAQALGPNEWLVDEMYEQYRADPSSVSESWQEFFADYRRGDRPAAAPPHDPGAGRRPRARRCDGSARHRRRGAHGAGGAQADATPTRSASRSAAPAARIVANMEAQPRRPDGDQLPRRAGQAARGQPQRSSTATSAARGGGKVSFTHLIGYAVVRAIADAVPVMNSTFVEGADGKPRVVRHEHVSLGLAVDVEKSDGSRTLVVPVIRERRRRSTSRGFLAAYEDLIRKVRTNKLDRRRLPGRHRDAHQPRHDRHGAVGAAADAGPGRDRRRRRASTTRPSTRAPTERTLGRARRVEGRHDHVAPTTTASSRAPSRACSSSACTSC